MTVVAIRPFPTPLLLLGAIACSVTYAGEFQAPTYEYRDKQTFLEATGASDVSGALPSGPSSAAETTVGGVTFQSHPPSTLNFAAWTEGLPDPFELALNGDEELNIVLGTPALGVGFEVEQATNTHPNINGSNVISDFIVVLCAETFDRGDACPTASVISTHRFHPPLSGPPDYAPSFFGLWAATPIAQLSIREPTAADGNEFFGRVFAGSEPRLSPLLDQFETDDSPQSASTLELFQSQGFERQYIQPHSIHNAADQDWVFHNVRLDRDIRFELISSDPSFHAEVAFFDVDRFSDAQEPPLLVLGDCGAAPAGIDEMVDSLNTPRSTMFQIRRCSGSAPVDYTLRYTVIRNASFSNEQVFRLSGSVTTASTGDPVGAFIRSNNGETGFSNPANGAYRMVLTKNIEHLITIESPNFEIQQEVIGPVGFLESEVSLDLQVNPLGLLFADGFE